MPRYLSSGSALLSVAWIALSSSMTEEVTAARMAAVVERVACEKARIAIKEANSAYGARMAAEVRGGPGCLRKNSASLSRASAEVRLPCGVAAG
jgi:hypothetical protein